MIKSKCVDRDRQTKSLVSHKLQTHMEQEQALEWEDVAAAAAAAQALLMSFSAYCVCTSARAMAET